MKPRLHLQACLFALATTSAFAQSELLTDSFDTIGLGNEVPPFNESSALISDQIGNLAPLDYTIKSDGWPGYIQRGSGGQMLLAGYDFPEGGGEFNGNAYASLNHNFADDANSLNSPLQIKFHLEITDSADSANWGSVAIGPAQNLFVNDPTNKFSSIFRDNEATQQFASGADVSDTVNPFTFIDGDEITLLLADTAGTGSAFNGNGSVAKILVNGILQFTSSELGLTASDGFVSFQAFGTKAYYDNLTITATSTAIPDYQIWANSFDPVISSPAGDDDNDGLSNQTEYAFGLLPNSSASVNAIAALLDNSTGTFSYTRRATPARTGLTYTIWFSENLSDWTEDLGAAEGTPITNGDVETVPVTLSEEALGNPLPDKLFIQVRAN